MVVSKSDRVDFFLLLVSCDVVVLLIAVVKISKLKKHCFASTLHLCDLGFINIEVLKLSFLLNCRSFASIH